MAKLEEAKLELFLQWLELNKVELRGCKIKYCDSTKGFGIFSAGDVSDGVLLVVPLDLAITPMRVLQDPLYGPECRALFEEGDVDDRFLITLFLTVERLRMNSSWKPYFDMLPTTFGNPLWSSDDELLELKGTTLHKATELQKKKLQILFDEKIKKLAGKLLALDGQSLREVSFEDFLWANSIFWSRALNIPFPSSYVFPNGSEGQDGGEFTNESQNDGVENQPVPKAAVPPHQGETIWVEGLVPGIDFCNHDLKAATTWEVDGTGSATKVPFSMYLLSAGENSAQGEREISISYGNKGNEELLYLYGFVVNDNPDDYLMIHYPVEGIQDIPFSGSKGQLLEAQKAELRCLLPKNLLNHGFFPQNIPQIEKHDKSSASKLSDYSWSGQRKTPSYIGKLVFPEEFLTALRTISMKEDELYKVSSLLEELVESGEERQPSDMEVRAAAWEACGDSGALQLLVDLLNMKMLDLEEGSGTEDRDTELLKCHNQFSEDDKRSEGDLNPQQQSLSKNKWCSIVYRRAQKQLTRLFLKEAEHALQLALEEGN